MSGSRKIFAAEKMDEVQGMRPAAGRDFLKPIGDGDRLPSAIAQSIGYRLEHLDPADNCGAAHQS
jgi:hypothetical protein